MATQKEKASETRTRKEMLMMMMKCCKKRRQYEHLQNLQETYAPTYVGSKCMRELCFSSGLKKGLIYVTDDDKVEFNLDPPAMVLVELLMSTIAARVQPSMHEFRRVALARSW